MAYVRKWVLLPDAVKLVMASGASRSEAKRDICAALVDGRIRFQPTIADDFVFPRYLIDSLLVPPGLSPRDIDWARSRPKKRWHSTRYGHLVPIAKIELSGKDVIRVLRRGEAGASSAQASARQVPPEKDEGTHAATAVVEKRPTAADEARAAKALEARFRVNPETSVREALNVCSEIGPALGPRPFRRVWQKARAAAGLQRKANAGRKPKSPHYETCARIVVDAVRCF